MAKDSSLKPLPHPPFLIGKALKNQKSLTEQLAEERMIEEGKIPSDDEMKRYDARVAKEKKKKAKAKKVSA